MTVLVRPAEPRDVARLQEIENAADAVLVDFFGATRWEPAPTGEQRASTPGFVLVVSESAAGDATGFAHVLETDGYAHLEQLSVLPSYARRGLGRTLVEAAKTEAGRRGYDRMTLRTYADVPWNAPFYATCGFVESEPETTFHRRLAATEESLGLEEYGRRIQLSVRLQPSA
jgi:GNAT superfamily N-acetyltransferase